MWKVRLKTSMYSNEKYLLESLVQLRQKNILKNRWDMSQGDLDFSGTNNRIALNMATSHRVFIPSHGPPNTLSFFREPLSQSKLPST